MEKAGIIKGVSIYNDSAATTMDGVAESLLMFSEPVIWIVQANCNVQDIDVYSPLIREKVKAIIAVGQDTDRFLESFWRSTRFYVSADTWSEALDMALLSAKSNDNVLFSPGARASEPFANYEERGAYFDKIVSFQSGSKA
jgi:UDP-N-acetylmuramoylalanine--D-glutamate ligase